MAVINRYTPQTQWAQYNPMSMQELAFAPTFLRQRHDAAQQGLADLDQASNEYDVLDQFGTVANQAVQPFQKSISELAEQLASQGVQRSQAIPQAMKLKSEYQKLFGQQGAIGQLQGRTQQYQERAKQLQEEYKGNPLLLRYALSQLSPGEATLDEDGQLSLSSMQDANMVRHINEEDILDRLDNAVKGLKPSDFGRSGIQYTGNIGGFNDIYTMVQEKRVDPKRIANLVKGMISQEEKLSMQQLAMATGQDPETAVENFINKAIGATTAHAVTDRTFKDFNITDQLSLHRAKQQIKDEPINANWEYDSVSQGLKIGGLDESYFKEHTPKDIPGGTFGMGPSGMITLPQNKPGDMSTTKKYKPFNNAQKLEAFEIISALIDTPIDQIPEEFIDSKKGRELLKDYYKKEGGKVQITPTIDNTDQLREYGGSPEKAAKDLMDNYDKRLLFDVDTGRQLNVKEFSSLLGEGKVQVVGSYSPENPFSTMAGNMQNEYFSNPLAVNITDENGKIIKKVAASRSPSYLESKDGIESMQYNKIYNTAMRTPNIPKVTSFAFVGDDGNLLAEVPIKVKYNSSSKVFEVSPIGNEFKPFTVHKTTDISKGILKHRN